MSNKKKYSSIQEHRIADTLNWQVVSGSGARPTHIGDVGSDLWLGECKTHTKPGNKLTFTRTVWDKIKTEASSVFKYPVLFVDDGSQSLSKTWCMFAHGLFFEDHVEYPFPFPVNKNVTFSINQICTYTNALKADKQINCPIIYNVREFNAAICCFDDFNSCFGE